MIRSLTCLTVKPIHCWHPVQTQKKW